jgi:hypothetical protein
MFGEQHHVIIAGRDQPLHLPSNGDSGREEPQIATSRRGARVQTGKRLAVVLRDRSNLNDSAVHEQGIHALVDVAHRRPSLTEKWSPTTGLNRFNRVACDHFLV